MSALLSLHQRAFVVFTLIGYYMVSSISFASGIGPLPSSLTDMKVPEVPGLLDGNTPIIINKEKAIQLGKALFWDTSISSDGIACASCHFHAGADSRTKNQLSPSGKSTDIANQLFDSSLTGQYMGANHNLSSRDFPFHQRQTPIEHTSPVTHHSDDVVSSAGTFSGTYVNSERTTVSEDNCIRSADPVFHVGTKGTRRVEPRNTPTIINAIFNHRSFWDGRANNVFNGSSPWGERDPDAGVWVKVTSRKVKKERLHLINSSLASLALAPPLSTTEMGCSGRSFSAIGRKLLYRKPLEHQKVHHQDSVLGALSFSSEEGQLPGLNTTYSSLIKQSFDKKYWSYRRRGPFGGTDGELPYTQIEANFGMFFALAIQLYEATLISDQSPFDISARDTEGRPIDLNASELNGFEQLRKNQCMRCHVGPNFTSASVSANAEFVKIHPEAFGDEFLTISTTENVISRTIASEGLGFFDVGFASTGVTDEEPDIGLGGIDDFGNPLSFSTQYLQFLTGNHSTVIDSIITNTRPCDFQEPFAIKLPFPLTSVFTLVDGIKPQIQSKENCFTPYSAYLPTEAVAKAELESDNNKKMLNAVNGAFKIPSLRNIELTGPYMHNGGMATLEQVIEFYTRGGNVSVPAKQSEKVFPLANLQHSEQNRKDLIAFLKTLTDDRVRYEKAPFDHPEIKIPHGHTGDNLNITDSNTLSPDLAKDEFLVIDAVGENGQPEPIKAFEYYLAP